MATLYDISSENQKLVELIEQNEGELTDEMKTQIENFKTINKKEAETKITGYCHLIKNKTASNKMLDAEIKRLQAKKKANTRTINWLKANLKFYFEENKEKIMELFNFKVTLVGGGGILPLIIDSKYLKNPEKLPEVYRTEIPKSYEVDTDAIRETLKREKIVFDEAVKNEEEEIPKSELEGIAEFGERKPFIKIS